ncbi:MAG: hypothetical protein KDA37_03710 [Planctomycetales bacterium]|nr:hypothetical protein [Planctomycetales bacterium]
MIALASLCRPVVSIAAPNFLTPGGQTYYLPAGAPPLVLDWPTMSWARGDSSSTYAEWDEFGRNDLDARDDNDTNDIALPAIEPDVDYSGFAPASGAVVSETTGAGFYTSSGNIYSPFAVLSFEATLPAPQVQSSQEVAYLVAQINTVATEVDPDSIRLSYDGGAQRLAPLGSLETQRIDASGGGFSSFEVSTLHWWEVTDAAPTEFRLEFSALGASMSLANLALDAFSPSPLAGDYDRSGTVDSRDYAEWRSQYGSTVSPLSGADGNGDGLVDAADYAVWRDAYAAPVSGVHALTVPEPGFAGYAGLFAIAIAFCWCTHRCVSPRN